MGTPTACHHTIEEEISIEGQSELDQKLTILGFPKKR